MKPSEKTIQMFMKDRFATDNGAVIEEVDDHYAKCSLRIEDRHRNAMGAVMGGVYFTLADFALAVASNWQKMENVSLNSEITYLTAAKGERLTAEAVCVKSGRTTGYYRIDVRDDLGNLTAAVTATTYRVAK
ncbi:MAG TPA: PaaI family thioesterase [Candidatus Mediterraneibacter stercorigallinarum]|uniref:PaaI family thioesterase n=1 Tax=Candidatus Mediterraneibacter stercorigallinarum TaxID=2838686 RepID=A0A9D2IJY3_9FIRM|nr:PaaI family thioesterase [Candidatus Mediterraneibacter stercorigallinarum]